MHNDEWHGISLVAQCSRLPHWDSSAEPWLIPWAASGDPHWLDGNDGVPVWKFLVANVVDSVGRDHMILKRGMEQQHRILLVDTVEK